MIRPLPSKGEWLGVDWDAGDIRGKHDGCHDGARFFKGNKCDNLVQFFLITSLHTFPVGTWAPLVDFWATKWEIESTNNNNNTILQPLRCISLRNELFFGILQYVAALFSHLSKR